MSVHSRRGATLTAISAVTVIALAGSVPASARSIVPLRGAWVVGDSITYLSSSTLKTRLGRSVHRPIVIDGVPGRPLSDLDDLVADELQQAHDPDVMVLALGTNPAADWRKSDLRAVVDSIPEQTDVVLVTVFRTPESSGAAVAAQMRDYSRWARAIAARRGNVCVADWRAAVSGHTELLYDGVHPTTRGQVVWARIIGAAVDACGSRSASPVTAPQTRVTAQS